MPSYRPVIGLEVHVQLLTASKVFCGCPNRFNPDQPNTQVCPVCIGLPGALPVLNERAFNLSLTTATALNCRIASFTKWDRKQYFYPDLPKGYQVSQYDLPFSEHGWLDIADGEGESQRVRILRIHLEEDAGKNLHDETHGKADSKVDLNRAGTPLMEIVTEPDIRTATQARAFLEELHLILTYLEVSDCNMQEGSLRCDANVNLHVTLDDGKVVATPIVEVKNLNSFRGIEQAVAFEIERQQAEFEKTGRKLGDPGVTKSTRGWDAERGRTFEQRGKEEASDYRYFPDPDLVPVTVSDSRKEAIRNELIELPAARRERFQSAWGLSTHDAVAVVSHGRRTADYFEAVARRAGDAKQASNWVMQDVARELNERKIEIGEFPISSSVLGTLLAEVVGERITVKSARDVFTQLMSESDEGQSPAESRVAEIICEKGLSIVRDSSVLDAAIDTVLAENPKAIEDLKAGKQQAIGPLIGKVMRQVQGADAKQVREMILDRVATQ